MNKNYLNKDLFIHIKVLIFSYSFLIMIARVFIVCIKLRCKTVVVYDFWKILILRYGNKYIFTMFERIIQFRIFKPSPPNIQKNWQYLMPPSINRLAYTSSSQYCEWFDLSSFILRLQTIEISHRQQSLTNFSCSWRTFSSSQLMEEYDC
jgi:hypothetical protein